MTGNGQLISTRGSAPFNFFVGIGSTPLQNLTTGRWNVAIVNETLNSPKTSSDNVAVGTNIGRSLTLGCQNTIVGNNAYYRIATGGSNVAIGDLAGFRAGAGNVFLVVIVAMVFLEYQYWRLQEQINDPNYLAELQLRSQADQSERVMDNLSKIYLLPDGDPIIAIIGDVEALRQENQEFYQNVQNDDLLIVFSEQAIIYRNIEGKIINIAPAIYSDQ